MSAQKCSVCSASLNNTLKVTHPKKAKAKQELRRSSPVRQNVTIQSFEDEYIIQLQNQIRSLEKECRYLRDQLDSRSIILTRSLNDNRISQIERERSDLQRSLIHTSSHFDQLSSENHGLTIALDELRRKFDLEKQGLIDELDRLRRIKDQYEQENVSIKQELRLKIDQSKISADELRTLLNKVNVLEQQLSHQINQNQDLQRSLSDYQIIHREKDRLQNRLIDLENENKGLKHDLKTQESRSIEFQTFRNKLIEEKNHLAKELNRLEILVKDLQRDCDQLRLTLNDRSNQIQMKENELMGLKKKEQSFRDIVQSLEMKLETETLKSRDLDEQLKQQQRQTNIEIQNTLIIKREMKEFENRCQNLENQLILLQREKSDLINQLNISQKRLSEEESLSNRLRLTNEELELRVREIDRLKSLEDLVQSQRWEEISQMANTMKTVSKTMARATSPTTIIRKSRIEY